MEDEQIVQLFFSRAEQAIQELDRKYGTVFYAIAHRVLNNRQDEEECVNDAYLGVWNTIPPARPNPLLPYVCKIVRNLSLKAYYRTRAAKRQSEYSVAIQEVEHCLTGGESAEGELDARELTGAIESFLDTLSRENRVIFLRRYWFSDSYREIAARMGMTEKTVSVRLTRIRRRMKQYLEERGLLR